MKPIPCGVEVSARTLLVYTTFCDSSPATREYPNTPKGHREICRALRRLGGPVRVCLEATGTYGLDVAMTLHQAPALEVMVANPRAVRRFAQALMRRAKTDRLDVEVLHEYAARMPFEPWKPPSPQALELRSVTRRIQALTHTSTAEKNRLHALEQSVQSSPLVRESIERSLEALAQELHALCLAARCHIRRHEALKKRFRLLLSIKGIGEKSALELLGELAALPDDLQARQWVASAGLDPRPYESGTSVHKPRVISRVGNRHLRKPLYMPALVAVRWDPHFKAFYQGLLQRGKRPLQALVAVMRKILHAIWGIWKNNQVFDGAKLFPKIRLQSQRAA